MTFPSTLRPFDPSTKLRTGFAQDRLCSVQRDAGAYGNTPVQQRGSTLLVALVMLVLLTLIAVSAINSTTSSIEMVGNAQFREEAIAAAELAVEKVISTGNFKTTAPAPQNIDINQDGTTDYTVTFTPAPSCVSVKPVVMGDFGVPSICASSIGAVCFWTVWDIRAVVNDAKTGASVILHHGVKTLAGLNVAVTQCGI